MGDRDPARGLAESADARSEPIDLDVAVVGAGFAGIYMLHSLRQLGLSVRLFEAAPSVGGVWYWNRYPGARCDVESADYSYSFDLDLEQEWVWAERFATRDEILSYLNHVVDRFDLKSAIELETRVSSAEYDQGYWTLHTEGPRGGEVRARFCVMATGCLSIPKDPEIPGIERFAGAVFHTARWPELPVSFAGKRIGVIGVGSSGTQLIPLVARAADHLYVLQRSPNYALPGPNAVADPEYTAEIKRNYRKRRDFTRASSSGLNLDLNRQSVFELDPDQREATFERYWRTAGFGFQLAFADLLTSSTANRLASEFIDRKIRAIVRDPDVARALTPTDHPVGAKRPSIDAEYYSEEGGFYESFNRPNVTLVDLLTTPIVEVTERGIRTTSTEIELDVIVFATGFDAMTGALLGMDLRGRGGLTLREKWRAGPTSFLGLGVSGFPNMLIVAGPGSPSVLSNVVVSIEQHVDWITSLIRHAIECDVVEVEVEPEAEADWVAKVNEIAHATLYPTANSWYLGANVPGKPRVFMPYAGGLRSYRRICDSVRDEGYRGFVLRPAPADEPSDASARNGVALSNAVVDD